MTVIPEGQEASLPEAVILVQEKVFVTVEGQSSRLARSSLTFFSTIDSKVPSVFTGTISWRREMQMRREQVVVFILLKVSILGQNLRKGSRTWPDEML